MSLFTDTLNAIKTYYTEPEQDFSKENDMTANLKFDNYLDRLSELIVEVGDETAALMILSIESDPMTVIGVLSDLLHGRIDNTAESVYASYVISGVSYETVQIAVEYFKKKYADRKLPNDIAYVRISDESSFTEEEGFNN